MKGTVAFMAMIAATTLGIIYLEASLWAECRADHSWLYCVRVLGSR